MFTAWYQNSAGWVRHTSHATKEGAAVAARAMAAAPGVKQVKVVA